VFRSKSVWPFTSFFPVLYLLTLQPRQLQRMSLHIFCTEHVTILCALFNILTLCHHFVFRPHVQEHSSHWMFDQLPTAQLISYRHKSLAQQLAGNSVTLIDIIVSTSELFTILNRKPCQNHFCKIYETNNGFVNSFWDKTVENTLLLF
jgi:hypothetical protein